MVLKIKNITAEPKQRHTLELDFLDESVTVDLTFFQASMEWWLDVYYQDKEMIGVKLVTGCFLLNRANLPFDFILYEKNNDELEPFSVTDLAERFELLVVDINEKKDIKDYVRR